MSTRRENTTYRVSNPKAWPNAFLVARHEKLEERKFRRLDTQGDQEEYAIIDAHLYPKPKR